MKHLKKQQLHHLENLLLEEKQRLEQFEELNEHFGLSDSYRNMTGELSAYDNHPGDAATETYERGKDHALREQRDHLLEQVSLALESMKTGTYGICVVCGAEIPYERLEAVPYTSFCVNHAETFVPDDRPLEELFLQPPFGRTSLDEADQTGFDGEDAWQIVASWGTSNSPALAEDRQIDDYAEVYEEEDEQEGYVEQIESFLATDLHGREVFFVRNAIYERYMKNREGDRTLERINVLEEEEEPE
jgi:YteA family regulatory protein